MRGYIGRESTAFCLILLVGLGLHVTAPPAAAVDRPLRIADTSMDPLTLHPHRSFDPNSDSIIGQIYEGLIDFNSEGNLVPKLAEYWLQQSPTRYRFWLRRGVSFHNGEPFDAEAVRSSVHHQFNETTRAANSWLFDPGLRVQVIDRYTLDLITDRPDARLPYTLPMFLKILPPKALRSAGDEGLARHPIGTGPYRFIHWERGRSVRLEAYGAYWRRNLPRIKSVSFLFLPEADQIPALLEGKVDLVTKVRGNDTFKVMAAGNTKILKRQVAMVFWAAMRNEAGPFSDRRVRQAMNYAVNKNHLIHYVDKGNALNVSTMTAHIERGHNPFLTPYPFDPEMARSLIYQAGYHNGFAVRCLASEETADMIRAIQAQLRMVGVTLELTIVPREEYLRRTIVPKIERGSPDFDGDMVVWLTPNPTMQAFFSPAVVFCSRSPYSIMNDPKFDRNYFAFVEEVDPDSRRQQLFRLQELMLIEAYGIYTSQRVQTYGLDSRLQIDVHPSGMLAGDALAGAFWQNP
ncbi:MAG: ABC transporter substrate-binding protein [Thermodesulfobacteriota bacterium]